MPNTPYARPEPLDVIPVERVSTLIADADRDFVELERRAAEATADAEEAERLAGEMGVDPKSSTWTMVRLQRFLDGLREEAARDAAATVQVARHRARVRIQEAQELAAGSPIAPLPAPPFSFAPADPPPAPVGVNGAGVSAEYPPWSGAPLVVAATSAAVMTDLGTPVAPAPAPPVFAPPPEPSSAPPLPIVGSTMPATAAPPPSPWEPSPTVAMSVPVGAAATAMTAEHFAPPTWSGAAPAAAPPPMTKKGKPMKARSSRRFPLSAILEVIAVLLILVFILLRLS